MFTPLNTLPHRDRYAWMISSVVPRPIAWVSTLSKEGVCNLAPFSYFNGVCSDPPIVSIAIGRKRGGVKKDTLTNIEETGELVINVVSASLLERMVATSGEYAPEVDEFEVAGLTPVPSSMVQPPRVREALLSFEAKLVRVVEVGAQPTGLVLAELIAVHCDDSILDAGGFPDPSKLNPISRLGGQYYANLGELTVIDRPR